MKQKAWAKPAWQKWTESDARAAFAELAETKETHVAFARRRRISVQRLQYWKKRFAGATASAGPSFVAVKMPAPMGSKAEIEIRVRDIVVLAREGCDVEEIARLVMALSRRGDSC